MQRQHEPQSSVAVEFAYRAAEERAVKTTRALILAEAQIIELEQGLAEERELTSSLRRRLSELEAIA